jgi:hypothetical protein
MLLQLLHVWGLYDFMQGRPLADALDTRAAAAATVHADLSRASAAALSTVLRTTTLSYGNKRFSGTCPAETPS